MTGSTDTTNIVVNESVEALTAVGDQVVDAVVRGIIAAHELHGTALACDVGGLIVEKFYGGDTGSCASAGRKRTRCGAWPSSRRCR